MIFAIIEHCKLRRLRNISLAIPVYLKKGCYMTKVLTLQNDAQAVVRLDGLDSLGLPIAVPNGTTVTTSDPTIFTASMNADGTILIVPVEDAIGSATLTAENGTFSDTAEVNVIAPALASISLDFADAAITAKNASTTTAAASASPASTAAIA